MMYFLLEYDWLLAKRFNAGFTGIKITGLFILHITPRGDFGNRQDTRFTGKNMAGEDTRPWKKKWLAFPPTIPCVSLLFYSSSFACFLYSSIRVFCNSNGTGTYSLKFMENFALPLVKERRADE